MCAVRVKFRMIFFLFFVCVIFRVWFFFFFSSRRRHTRYIGDWSSDVCSSDLLWARTEMYQAVDILFIDEAGQMCLADVLAVSQAATSCVLLGDPQQLDQPQRGDRKSVV